MPLTATGLCMLSALLMKSWGSDKRREVTSFIRMIRLSCVNNHSIQFIKLLKMINISKYL